MKKYSLSLAFSLLIISLNAQTFEWGHSIGSSTGNLDLKSIAVDGENNTVSMGYFTGTCDFDPGPGVYNLTSGINGVFILKLDSLGNFVWARALSPGSSIDPKDAVIGANNHVYVTGSFQNFVDFDPGPGNYTITAPGSFEWEVFVLDLDENGNFNWVRNMGGSNGDYAYKIFVDDSLNVYTTGMFNGMADFDPGAGTSYLMSPGGPVYYNAFLSKLDSAGNYKWAIGIGGNNDEVGKDIAVTANGNVLWAGTFMSPTIDADAGAGTTTLTCAGSLDGFLIQLDSAGNFIDVKQIGGSSHDNLAELDLTNDGTIYMSGQFFGTTDFDPGPGVSNLTASLLNDAFMVKLDPAGNFEWAKRWNFNGTTNPPGQLSTDVFNNVYLNGMFTDSIDFDPGISTYYLHSPPGYNVGYTLKLDSAGNFVWAGIIEGTNHVEGYCIDVSNAGNIFIGGRLYDVADLDPGPGTYSPPFAGGIHMYIVNLGQDVCSNMTIVFDSIVNLSCSNPGYGSAHGVGGVLPYSYVWNTFPPTNNSLANFDSTSIYSITVTDTIGCTKTRNILIDGPASTIFYDLNVNLVNTNFVPGFDCNLWVDAYNDGCLQQSGSIKLVLDTLVTFNNSIPPPDLISGDTIIWNFTNIDYTSGHLISHLSCTTSPMAVIGDSIDLTVMIDPIVGDVDTLNNVKTYLLPVVNAYDPNDKKIYPQGVCNPNYVLADQNLTYTIRFQNTGNSNAVNIYILDTLDSDLDLNSLRVVSSSHSVITEIINPNIVKFIFNNIQLPDSNTNEPLSHGFVIYQIQPDSNTASNTIVENTSYIFFDFNPAIITNTTQNTIVDSIPNTHAILNYTACVGEIINGYQYYTDGTYIQHLTNSAGCDSTLTLNLSIDSLNNSVSQTGFTLTANEPSAFYQWIDCNNLNFPLAGENFQSFTATTNGNYAVIVTANGCSDTSTCYAIFGFGLEDQNFSSGLIVSPNPTHSLLNITSKVELKNATLIVTDINGKNLSQKNELNGNSFQVDLSELNTGMYFIHIFSEGKKGILKVVKK